MGFKENKPIMIKALLALGIHTIKANGSGSGDSGEINEITAFDDDQAEEVDLEKSTAMVEIMGEASIYNAKTKKYVTVKKLEKKLLKDAVRDFIYDAVGATGVDWYNNDGGDFDLTFDVKKGEVKIIMGVNATVTNHEEYVY